MSMTPRRISTWLGLCACAWMPAQAQLIIEDKLTGRRSLPSYWQALGGACLTAGTAPESDKSSIPACKDLTYYKSRDSVYVGGTGEALPETDGKGALRLTNGDTTKGTKGDTKNGVNSDAQRGAVVSKETFPSHRGVQVTFTTVTYGGDGYSTDSVKSGGADGMSFYLMDGSVGPSFGAIGGSLGYSCSNRNAVSDGVRKGYLGIGIDEYGNFAHAYDNTATGDGFRPGRISVRGAGDINWARLHAEWPTLYPQPLVPGDPSKDARARVEAVHQVCETGLLHNLSGVPATVENVRVAPGRSFKPEKGLMNYPLLEPSDLPEGTSLSNQQAVPKPRRAAAKPITYALKITQDGYLSFSYSIDRGNTVSVIKDRPITAGNGELPKSFRFGFSGSTGSGSNVHEITCFKAAPVDQAESSAVTNIPQSARVEAGTQLYLANYHPVSWWGELTAQTLLRDPVTDTVSVNPVANWNASCVLTGGACPSTGRPQTAQAPQQRRMLTWTPGENGRGLGVPFQWGSLSKAQQAALKSADASKPTQILDYLRGDRSREVANKGPLRTRIGVLGDIIHAGPAWVGAPASPYAGPWVDALFPRARVPEQGYAVFQSQNVRRQNVVYAGANDGWLHGFRAGGYDAQGLFDATIPNDGLEVLAYMPAAVLTSVHPSQPELDYSATRYVHAYHVDATPGTGDLYYAGAWHTWLVGGLGAGGQPGGPVTDKTKAAPGAFYALDITDPQRFSEANAAALVVGEWSAATLTCGGLSNCGQHLGSVYGTPQIRRLHNGGWAVLSGNGLNSPSGTAGLFVMGVDPLTGATSWRFIDTGHGASRDPLARQARNGIVQVTAADLDGDHITDYVYGGDAFGNVWRFDLTSDDPARWTASATPLFSTGGQPITTRIVVASVPHATGAAPRVILGFGTGQRRVQTLDKGAEYDDTGSHAVYGVWDWDLAGWNAKAGPKARYSSLAAPQTVNRDKLLAQSVLKTVPGSGEVSGYRTVSRSKVCWAGTAGCPGDSGKFGWVLPLPQGAEQVIYHPVIAYGMLLVNTTIPEESRPLSCDDTPASGFTMALTMGDGGAANASFFANAGNQFVSYDGEFVSGIGLGATGTPSIVSADGRPWLVEQTTKGDPVVKPINPPPGGLGGRLTWMELR